MNLTDELLDMLATARSGSAQSSLSGDRAGSEQAGITAQYGRVVGAIRWRAGSVCQ